MWTTKNMLIFQKYPQFSQKLSASNACMLATFSVSELCQAQVKLKFKDQVYVEGGSEADTEKVASMQALLAANFCKNCGHFCKNNIFLQLLPINCHNSEIYNQN